MVATSWGSAAGIARFARLTFTEEHPAASAAEASAKAITTSVSFSSVTSLKKNGTAYTSYTGTSPKTITLTALTAGDILEYECIDSSCPPTDVTNFLTDARTYIETRIHNAGFAITTLSDDLADMLVNKYGAAMLLLARQTAGRQAVTEYIDRLLAEVEAWLARIDAGELAFVDNSGTETDSDEDSVAYNDTGDSEFRDSDGDWEDTKW